MLHETVVETDAFVGRWHGLISTTNWEKGRIISEWRQSLMAQGAEGSDYRDETWSEMVGAVTPQHVGRLRRVHERFAEAQDSFRGLYWSHFHAAIDWEDAEMWLEGAVQNGWSISKMRQQRWETLGSIPDLEPRDEVVSGELDEDVLVNEDEGDAEGLGPDRMTSRDGVASQTDKRGAEAKVENEEDEAPFDVDDSEDETQDVPAIRPFAELPELPTDLSDALEAFKLAIIRHRMSEWEEVSQQSVLASLDALKQFVTAV